jgi:hypothetical protein
MRRCVLPLAALAAGLSLAPLAAQDDLRDVVERRDGRQVTGRVLTPFATDELVIVQGGKRVRVPRADVAKMDLVADRVRTFCERRVKQQKSPKAQAFLVDLANDQKLPALARLQAMWVVLNDDTDERVHELLGHTKGSKGWLWEHDGKRMTLEQLDVALAKSPMKLRGERFTLQCDAGLKTNVGALLDLEHLGVVWFDRFGKELGLHEVLQPVDVVTVRNDGEFPKWGFRPVPYFVPAPHGDVARTFYTGSAPVRPERLFFVGTHGLLYHSLIGEVSKQDERDRVCAWLEIGLGMQMELTMAGPCGYAAPGPLRMQGVEAMSALNRGYRLTHLLHLPMYGSFYLTDDMATATNWSAAAMFVSWLLLTDNKPPTRERFLELVKQSLGERKGDSTTAFDKIMGTRVEDMDAPWREWLNKKAGY